MNKDLIIIPLVVAVGFLIFPFVAYYGNQVMVISSTSMLPALHPNDLIIVEPATTNQIKEGDIITFESHMEFGVVAHRAVDFHQENGEILIVRKGDNIDDPDPWIVTDEDLIGKVIKVIPTMGILLVGPVRYLLVAVITITAIFLLKESFESKSKTEKS
ncbi:MAG: signal peptidase I [Thaumarchaeota archaeon]|nr:signal peptidase I [Nitrososphaerota archaeon]